MASMEGSRTSMQATDSSNNVGSSRRDEGLVAHFAAAAQPEVMRAAEKDANYVGQVCEACYDAFRHTFGTRLAVAYQNEMKLAGRILYYLLTTGSALQTLGEEYCDIVQVSGVPGLPATPARRTLLVFYQTVLPYLAERLSGSRNYQHGDQAKKTGSPDSETTPGLGGSLKAMAAKQLLPSVREGLVLLMRTHLMLFYFEGLYYHMGKRAAGIRYIFTGRPSQQRPRYQMLGMFLLVQLTFVFGHWLSRTVFPSIASSMRLRATDPSMSTVGSHGITLVDEDGGKVEEKGYGRPSNIWAESEATPSSKCPLCLSPRQHPTATPCGHVFCWNCIAEWCNEKPECPLCRSPVSHPELVCVYHADF
ncbi:hypothetical protein R1sor_014809 [Riccia sorocarpa]|uniref:RING-type E3 ubiquitin transferase n=1 Tax=Riccia sorocarpa TaxID=122646 RepID=A0ABD3HAF9_9MARC